jgi:DNA-directed RNA polymerase specialized sigma24 family protein
MKNGLLTRQKDFEEEAAQQAIVESLAYLGRVDQALVNVRKKFRACDFYRRASRFENVFGEISEPISRESKEGLEKLVHEEMCLKLDEAMSELTPKNQELIKRRAIGNESFTEIAKLFGISEHVLRYRYKKIVIALKAVPQLQQVAS